LRGFKTRLEELKRQGNKDVQAFIIEAPSRDALMMHIAENLARGSVDPISIAQVLAKATEEGISVEELAKITSHTPEWVRFYLALVDMPEEYQQALREGKLNVTHIRVASQLDEPEEIAAALNTAIRLEWTASQLSRYVESRLATLKEISSGGESGPPPPPPSVEAAAQMVRYSSCGICQRMVETKSIRVPGICEECISLGQWITKHLGEPGKAGEEIHKAVSYYRNWLNWQNYMATQTPAPKVSPVTPSPPPSFQPGIPPPPSSSS